MTKKTYVAIIGDMISSRSLAYRGRTQRTLVDTMNDVNDYFSDKLASKFIVTLGDEFQGLLIDCEQVLTIINFINDRMYPIQFRFGIGVGEMLTDIDPQISLGADGPAYYNARNSLKEIKIVEAKNTGAKSCIRINIENKAVIADLLNTIFMLLYALEQKWTQRQSQVIREYEHGKTQSEIAQTLGVTQPNVQKILASAKYYSYKEGQTKLNYVLSHILVV